MIGVRYEEYSQEKNLLPFVFNYDLLRTKFNYSLEQNWHNDLEIQICTNGQGWVLLNGEKHDFSKGDIVCVNSNVIHYTGADESVTYSCIIIKSWFFNQLAIDYKTVNLPYKIKSETLCNLIAKIKDVYIDKTGGFRTAKLYNLITEFLLEILKYSIDSMSSPCCLGEHEMVKNAIKYLRENYATKIYIDDIAKQVTVNKYTLCRIFKKLTGQTIIENLNRYRVLKSQEYLEKGYSIGETAIYCGFENLSFFSRIFQRYTGTLPSKYVKDKKN